MGSQHRWICLYITIIWAFAATSKSVVEKNLFQPAQDCRPDVCKLPDCYCSGTSIPGGFSAKDIPQIVTIAFDDAVNAIDMKYYERLLNNGEESLKNPNGCNATATFFVNHEWTNYWMVNRLHHYRHEIADLTVTKRLPIAWWRTATYEQWKAEIMGERSILNSLANIKEEDVKGFRAPYLEVGGNSQFRAVHDAGFLYDSSMPSTNHRLWPYTLEYKSTQDCDIPPCPTDSFPGLWEFPMTDYIGKDGAYCNEVDSCKIPANESEAYQLLKINFLRHYTSNRAPFPVFLRARWFQKWPYTLDAMAQFLDYLGTLEDVYLVTISQAIEWIKTPTPLSKIKEFKHWQCKEDAPSVCEERDGIICPYNTKGDLVPQGQPAYHFMHICSRPCPLKYPWIKE